VGHIYTSVGQFSLKLEKKKILITQSLKLPAKNETNAKKLKEESDFYFIFFSSLWTPPTFKPHNFFFISYSTSLP
jgi:hypothetical protein